MSRLIKRNFENHDCIAFNNCKVKKVGHPILSLQNTSSSTKDDAASFGNASRFGAVGTVSSTVTPLSSSASYTKFSNDYSQPREPHQGDAEMNDDSSSINPSLTPLSGVSTSSINIDEKVCDYQRDSAMCSNYSSPESSTLSLLSGEQTALCDVDLRTKAMKQSEQRSSGQYERSKQHVRRVGSLSDRGSLWDENDSIRLEVVGNGTRLMRTIQFPTVIIQMRRWKLRKSVVYYAILKSAAGRYVGDIAALLFDANRSKNVQTAELLPLYTIRAKKRSDTLKLSPMLLRVRYRSLFQEGCAFEVKTIERGGFLDLKTRLWENYDLEKWEMHDLLSSLLYLNIGKIPAHMLKLMTPLLDTEKHLPKRIRRRRKSDKSLQYKKNSGGIQIQRVSHVDYNLHYFSPNTKGASSLASWYQGIPQFQIKSNKEFVFGLKPNKSERYNDRKYNKFFNLSQIV